MKKDFEVKPFSSKTKKILQAITIPMAAVSMISCGPFEGPGVVIGLPGVESIRVDQTITVIDANTKAPVQGLKIGFYRDDSLLVEGYSADSGKIEATYFVDFHGALELQISDIDGSENKLYSDYKTTINSDQKSYIIELTEKAP